MANTIKIKNSGTASAVPSSLEFGELGLNYADGKIYFKNLANTIAEFTTPPNLVIQNTAPANTSVLWADTSVIGVGVVPVGGTTGQVLSKGSNTSYDAVWANAVSSSDLALKANIASPTFTGTVTIPTGASISGFAPLASPTFTGNVSGISATMVGLGNVTNTSDASKPVSTAQQTALDLKAPLASPTFTGTATFPNVTIDGASGTISSQGVGNFKTIAGNGRGVGISGGTGDTESILQFTNNAVSAQWASISSTSGVLNLNATYTRASTNLAIGTAATGYRLEVDGRARIRTNDGGTAGIWYTNAAGTETVFGGLATDTQWGVYVSGAWRFSTTSDTFTVNTTNITLAGTGTNAISIPYCAMLINRLWDGYPGIQVNNDTTYGGVGEFRVHGYSGISGGDFGVNFRIDGTYLTASDMRMKTDISTIGGALDTVKNLRGVKYSRINRSLEADIPETSMTEGVKYGFIAQEIMEHAPEVVFQTPNHEALENGWSDEYAVDYGGITPLLVEAIKELEARLSAVEGAQ
jgi:hypothetical protein